MGVRCDSEIPVRIRQGNSVTLGPVELGLLLGENVDNCFSDDMNIVSCSHTDRTVTVSSTFLTGSTRVTVITSTRRMICLQVTVFC